VLITPENFGMVSGLMKDFLERIYPWFEDVPNRRPGMPYLLIAKGGNDGTGAVRDVTRIVTGLRWKPVLPPLVVSGSVTDEHLAAAREQAATLAAGVDAGVF
jgi:multimeric flavodoxin WrbA